MEVAEEGYNVGSDKHVAYHIIFLLFVGICKYPDAPEMKNYRNKSGLRS